MLNVVMVDYVCEDDDSVFFMLLECYEIVNENDGNFVV